MARIAPLEREKSKGFETVFEITEAVLGFVPNSRLTTARAPNLFAAFVQLSVIVVARPGRIDPRLKAYSSSVASTWRCDR